jgi:O-antigen/teichoic acid export membrane protein
LSGAEGQAPEPSSVARGAVRGTLWLASSNYITFALSILINLAVMRILDFAQVGAWALAVAVNEFIGLVGAFSLDLTVIHFKEDEEGTLFDTAYILSLLLGIAAILISCILYLTLGLFAPFTQEVRLLIVLLALVRPIQFLSTISMARMEKDFRYRTVSIAMLAATNLPNVLALLLVLAGGGAIALISRDIGVAILSYLVYGVASRWRCGWRWSTESAMKVIRYSNRMFVTRVLEVVLQRFDRLVLGSAVGTAELGVYHNGRYLAEMGYTFAQPVGRLSFNVYSRMKDDPARLSRAYRLVNFFLIRGSVLIGLVLAFLPREFVMISYGPKWLPSVPTVRLLSPYAAALPILTNMILLLYGRGMMRESVIVRSIQVAIFVPGVLLATSFLGPDATGGALLATTLVGMGIVVFYQRGIVGFGGRELFLPPALAFLIAGAFALAIGRLSTGSGVVPCLFRLAAVSGAYAAALAAIDRKAIGEHYRYLRAMIA